MTDFKAIARARGLDIPEAELERVARSLEVLETAFRPLAAGLPPALEPATALIPFEVAE